MYKRQHITVEGKAISKRRKDSTPRHYYGKGNIGCDIGTQTIAYTSNTEVGLENLAERGNSIQHVERQGALILRAMERSRRAMNPNHYNENGTVKKGHKQWNFSKRYQKLRQRHQELCRIADVYKRQDIPYKVYGGRTELVKRLLAEKCELCGSTENRCV